MSNISDIRREYNNKILDIGDVKDNPIEQFQLWFEEARNSEILEPNAMHLSTVNESGKPSGRIVLLKDISEEGLTFYTNFNSRKSREIDSNPNVNLTFFWDHLERQVHVEGIASKIDRQTAIEYFHKRPRESQIGAWASPQSQEINDRELLNERWKYYEDKFKDRDVPKPPHWGGYLVMPVLFEFWQGGSGRLHDRIYYSSSEGGWKKSRLAP